MSDQGVQEGAKRAITTRESLVTGCVSGIGTALITQPFDVLRTVMQVGSCKTSMRGATKIIIRESGVTGLWRGVVPTIYRVGAGTGVYFGCLNQLKFSLATVGVNRQGSQAAQPSSAMFAFGAGFVARGVAATAVMPLTVVKTRFEAGDRSFGGMFQTLSGIARTERGGLFAGVVPTIMRDAPFSGVYLLCLTKIMALSHLLPSFDVLPSSAVTFGAGLVAGTLATVVTNPPDVVRTRMQVRDAGGSGDGAGNKRMRQVMREIVRQEGVAALFTLGLAPRVVKKSFQAAMTWTLYQHITEVLTRASSFGGRSPVPAPLSSAAALEAQKSAAALEAQK
eukprot:CAMPEP_0181290912 /NCGR_PEP_ID=MMETSP1101-20121128/1677_1 /TAXON_ID=46948 /ORGANISM="Rhodomonas abbreviata, Strain Caron Lab Isolate" /LENGTH=336 /DNA_ID=CAMNT_0023395249 /DNA_START=494 /DNA_END=1504 /DNA_ORIENTATION=+